VFTRYLYVMTILQKFGLRIKELRSSKNITQENLAELTGLSRQYIGDVERGTRNISLINVEKIAKALGTSLSELFKLK
jgi:transcriptional regulator with XRE-family HTH domain